MNAPSVAFPANPIPAPKTRLGKEAKRLYDAAIEAAQRIREAREAATEAATELIDAKAALHAEIERGGREGRDADREHELATAVATAGLLKDPAVFHVREEAARTAHEAAVHDWSQFIRANLPELLTGEMEAEAERVSAALVEGLARLAPIELAYAQFHKRAQDLVVTARGYDPAWNLAAVPEPPLPPRGLYHANALPSETRESRETY
jgi:hypothetical protein